MKIFIFSEKTPLQDPKKMIGPQKFRFSLTKVCFKAKSTTVQHIDTQKPTSYSLYISYKNHSLNLKTKISSWCVLKACEQKNIFERFWQIGVRLVHVGDVQNTSWQRTTGWSLLCAAQLPFKRTRPDSVLESIKFPNANAHRHPLTLLSPPPTPTPNTTPTNFMCTTPHCSKQRLSSYN